MIGVLVAGLLVAGSPGSTEDRAAVISRRIADPDGGLVVVAHRGCHAPAPKHGLGGTPENSRDALEHCVTLGVDVMETDVRRAKDGTLVMIHDALLDRTTDGHGPVADMTIEQLRQLRLRDGFGGPQAALTDQRILTLDEMLALASGRIVLNLDVKDAIYSEVVDAVRRAHAERRVIVKTTASIATRPLAGMAPFDQVPFMPVLRYPSEERQLLDVAAIQLHGRKPLGFELPPVSGTILPDLAALARRRGVRLWINTLEDGYVLGSGGDEGAGDDPDRAWGALVKQGISMLQTDKPEALISYARAHSASDNHRLR
jgi:glycerophosphoryl diester phosphodiesterase